MTPRHLALIAAAFAALLLLWGTAALVRGGTSSGETGRVLPAIAPDAVDTVTIARPTDTTLLVRRDSASWTVNGFPADRALVGGLLEALADSARAGEPVAERTGSHAGLGVDSVAGARVRIAGRGETQAELVVGQRSSDLDGGYVRRAGDSTVYLWRGPLVEHLGRGSDEWRDRRIAAVPPDSVAALEISRRGRSFRLAREEGAWSFGQGRPADSSAVRGLLDAYRRLEAAGFASPAQADSARFAPPDRAVRLLRADGTPLLALAMDSTAGAVWARVDGDSVVYRLDGWTADRLAPPDSSLRARPASP